MAISFKNPAVAGSATIATNAVVDPVEHLALTDLREMPQLQPRAELFNEDHVQHDLLPKILDGVELDPVEVVREVMADGSIVLWLWHGHNRLEGYRRAGVDVIKARVRTGTFRMARELSLTTNDRHGLKLTDADKARKFDQAVDLFKEEIEAGTLGNNELARRTNLSPSYVSGRMKALRAAGTVEQPATRKIVRNGKPMSMDTAAITGRKPNATVAELKEFLANWVIDNYPDAIQESLTAIVVASDKAEYLYGQMEGIPAPHRQQDIIEAARLLLNEESSRATEESSPETPESGHSDEISSAPVAPVVVAPKPAKSVFVCAKEPTLTLIVSKAMAERILALAEEANDTEIAGAVRDELNKVAK